MHLMNRKYCSLQFVHRFSKPSHPVTVTRPDDWTSNAFNLEVKHTRVIQVSSAKELARSQLHGLFDRGKKKALLDTP